MKPEQLIFLPLETVRKAGEAVLWVTELLVPPAPSYETKAAASITIYSSRPEEPEDIVA
jgi:hypothetical protein